MNSKEAAKKVISQIRTGTYEDWVLKISAVMDEYRSIGEQEMAIKFTKFIMEFETAYKDYEDKWVNIGSYGYKHFVTNSELTTEQLYELFKQSL